MKRILFLFYLLLIILCYSPAAGNSIVIPWNCPGLICQKRPDFSKGLSISTKPEFPDDQKTDSLIIREIPEVTIQHSRHTLYNEDKKTSYPDSLIMSVFSGVDLGQLITLFTPAYLNSTGGPGATSSLSIRGANSYQTNVNWNGFILNSVTLGTQDFSSIPVNRFQELSVVHGASGSIAGSGNFGGSVILRNRPDWNNSLNFYLESDLGSYNNRKISASVNAGNENLQYQFVAFTQKAENNFSFTDKFKSGYPVESMQNNALESTNIFQNIFVRLPDNSLLESGVWYSTKKKEVPATMGSYLPGNAMQRDSSLRVYTKWTKHWTKSAFYLNTALFDESMIFRDKAFPGDLTYSIDSRISTRRLMGDINYRYLITPNLTLDTGAEINSRVARADSYGNKVSEISSAAITALKVRFPGFTGNASVRKEITEIVEVPLLFSAGIKQQLPVKGLSLKTSYSDQFRIPTLNDRYWKPGGNPDLLPESGYTLDLGFVQDITIYPILDISIEVSGYNSAIKEMIQWIPSPNSSWWTPENRKEVNIMGVESSIELNGKIAGHNFSFGLMHNLVSSTIGNCKTISSNSISGNQLMYIPKNSANGYLNILFDKLHIGLTGNYTGERYTENENNPLLKMPHFYLFNSHVGYKVKIGDFRGQLNLRIMNMLNSQYQVVRAYPMPGRTFHLRLSLRYNQ